MTWEEIIKLGKEFTDENKITKFGLEVQTKEFTPIKKCVNMPKPILTICEPIGTEFYVDEQDGVVQCHWQHGEGFPAEKHGKSWYIDSNTIFFFERPFNNTPVEILKKLLPNCEIGFDNNDVMINGKKVGPSMRTGWQKEKGHITSHGDGRTEILQQSEPLTGRVYCLRWGNLEGLNEIFKDVRHHQDRLHNKAGLTTLMEYLEPLGITKAMFEKMLEEIEMHEMNEVQQSEFLAGTVQQSVPQMENPKEELKNFTFENLNTNDANFLQALGNYGIESEEAKNLLSSFQQYLAQNHRN